MSIPSYEQEWQRWREKQKIARAKMLAKMAEDERKAREAAEATNPPANPEAEISVINLRILNGVPQPQQIAVPSQTSVKTKQFQAANVADRQNRR